VVRLMPLAAFAQPDDLPDALGIDDFEASHARDILTNLRKPSHGQNAIC
jgi:hypothetical protein